MDQGRSDWLAIGAYAAVAVANQMLWLTFAPITTESAQQLGVSEDAIGWLSEIFPLLYVVLAIPAGILLDRWLDSVLLGAAALTAFGGIVRLASDEYGVILAGQVLIAIAQPAVLGAVTKLAAERVVPESRTLAISLGSAGIFGGALSALVLGATIGADGGLDKLLAINAFAAIGALALGAVALRRPAPHESEGSVRVGAKELREIYSDPVLRRLSGAAFLGFGVFVATTTWLQVLLEPSGISDSTAGWILVCMTAAGVIGALLLPEPVAERSAEERFLRTAAWLGAGAFAVLAASQTAGAAVAAGVVVGFALLGALPVILEISERRAGERSASAAGAIWLAGNLGGIVIALSIQALTDHPAAAFIVLAAAMLAIVPIVRGLLSPART